MKLTREEIEYLSAWSREEWEPDCYRRPAHRLQLSHALPGAYLIDLIKAWTEAEGKKDQEILDAAKRVANLNKTSAMGPAPRSSTSEQARWSTDCNRSVVRTAKRKRCLCQSNAPFRPRQFTASSAAAAPP